MSWHIVLPLIEGCELLERRLSIPWLMPSWHFDPLDLKSNLILKILVLPLPIYCICISLILSHAAQNSARMFGLDLVVIRHYVYNWIKIEFIWGGLVRSITQLNACMDIRIEGNTDTLKHHIIIAFYNKHVWRWGIEAFCAVK